jgi:ribonuclease T2
LSPPCRSRAGTDGPADALPTRTRRPPSRNDQAAGALSTPPHRRLAGDDRPAGASPIRAATRRGGSAVARLSRSCAAASAAAVLLAASAAAQSPREDRGAAPGRFDFYVLALSWSPGFCEASGDQKGREQCRTGSGLGFVVHGLWPQYERGYPAFCEPSGRPVSRPALEEAEGVFPDEGLARYEWRKHGTCTGESPAEYFRAARRARDLVAIPESLRSPRAEARVLPLAIERAFADANRGLRPEMMAVACGRRTFQEVRICLDRDLRGFRACPEIDRDGCRAGEIAVPPVR